MKRFWMLLLFILMTTAVACTGSVTSTSEPTIEPSPTAVVESPAEEDSMASAAVMPPEAMSEATSDHAMSEGDMSDTDEMNDTSSEPPAEEDTDPVTALAAWQTLPLTNARTGETFTLGDFSGQTVLIEPMATWCSNCRQQLLNVQQAQALLGEGDVVFVALSVETNISDAELASYADGQGFDWTFAVMSPEILQELANSFGRTVANPPSTPHFVIRPDGAVTELFTGIQSPEEIVSLING